MMAEPVRVLHFADVHIGMENYGKTDPETGLSSRVVDFLHRMDEMVEYARENDVDLVIFAGDAFKTRTPEPTFQREFAWRIRDLTELAPVVMLVGNHDLPPIARKASSIEIYDTLAVPNVWVAHEYEVKRIKTKRGDVIVGAAPYPIRARLMQDVRITGMTIKQTDDLLENKLSEILESLADDADNLAGEEAVPRILTAHFTVRGASLGSERNVMLGRDVQISPGILADPRWDYVALGHIHKHQNLTEKREGVPPMVYSGSIERIDFGEEGDPKGFCWIELERYKPDWRFVPLKARPMLTLRVDCRKDSTPTSTVLKMLKKFDLNGAIVRIGIQLTPETDALLKDNIIREALNTAGVFHIAAIKRDVERPERTRLGASPEGLTNEELLERYLMSRNIEEDRRDVLIAAAREIIHET
jgi:DNA repair protein SbcD/Mre11